jgi:hypothetical protein
MPYFYPLIIDSSCFMYLVSLSNVAFIFIYAGDDSPRVLSFFLAFDCRLRALFSAFIWETRSVGIENFLSSFSG